LPNACGDREIFMVKYQETFIYVDIDNYNKGAKHK